MAVPYSFSGATPIESAQVNANFNDLDSRIDTAVNNTGLVYIKSQTVGTAVTTVTVTNAFSATWDAYKIVLAGGSCTTTGVLSMQLGSTTTNYKWSLIYTTYGSTQATLSSSSDSKINYVAIALPDGINGSVEVMSPQLAKNTYVGGTWTAASESGVMGGTIQNTTQYTAFTLNLSAGTMTGGTITVYGYRKG